MSQDMAHIGNHKQLRMEWEVGNGMKVLERDWPGTGLDCLLRLDLSLGQIKSI